MHADLANRVLDAWAVVRTVPHNQHVPERDVQMSGLADDLLEVANIIRRDLIETPSDREKELATALLTMWGVEGGECAHGVGIEDDCDGDSEDDECQWQEIRPALRAALEAVR